MRWVRFAVFIIVVTVLQADFIKIFGIADVKPDLLLILLVFFAIYCDLTEAIITSFAIGFAWDMIGPSMGPGIISFGLFGTALAYLHQIIAIRHISYQAVAIFLVALFAGTMAYLLSFFKGQQAAWGLLILIGSAFYSCLLGPFLFLPSAWVMNIKKHKQ